MSAMFRRGLLAAALFLGLAAAALAQPTAKLQGFATPEAAATALAEAVPGYQSENWYGIAAPPKTPEPILAMLTAAILKVMADPAVKAKYDEVGLHPATLPKDQYIAFLQRDSRTWGNVVTKGNIKIDEN